MLVVAKAIVVVVAIFFLVQGAAALVRPALAHNFLLGFANSALKHYGELLARFLVGGSLLLVARDSAYSTALSAFGWLLIGTTALMALVPWRMHHRFAQSAVPKALRFLPLIGITSLVIGALLLWVIVVLSLLPLGAQAQSWTAESCKSALLSSYTTMEQLPHADGGNHETLGDYNSDNIPDVAFLLRPKSNDRKQSIGVCLSNVSIPVLIDYAYVPGNIYTKPKGSRYDDYDLGKSSTYERDVISVNNNECCGASYVLRGGVFVEIVDSD